MPAGVDTLVRYAAGDFGFIDNLPYQNMYVLCTRGDR